MTMLALKKGGREIPAEHRPNFRHLYLDIAWFGVLNGSAISFMAVFATRLGANGLQIGLLNAVPAVISLFVTLPAGAWLQRQPIGRAVFATAVAHRVFYLPWIFLPFFLAPQLQIRALILLVLLMSIPGTALAVGFNALFAAVVPPEWRGHVVGVRNALLSVTFILVSLICGAVLEWLPFPLGYQVVFGLGVLGAAMSSWHLWFIRPVGEADYRSRNGRSLGDWARPGKLHIFTHSLRTISGDWRFLLNRQPSTSISLRQLDSAFTRLIVVLFGFHLVQYLAIPLFPLYWVNQVHFTDQHISLGNALFYVSVLVGSTQLSRLTDRLGNHRLMSVGALGMSLYPALTAVMQGLPLFFVASIVGGLAWAVVGGASGNYLLEKIPEGKRPSYLAWYNLSLNTAVLLGSLVGPLLAEQIGLVAALSWSALGRVIAAILIWRKG